MKKPGWLGKTIYEEFMILFTKHFNSYINYHHQWINNNVYKENCLLYTSPKGSKFIISYKNMECGLPGMDVDVPWRDKVHDEWVDCFIWTDM